LNISQDAEEGCTVRGEYYAPTDKEGMTMRFQLLLARILDKWLFPTVLLIVLLIVPAFSFAASNELVVRGFLAASVGGKSELGDKSPPVEVIYGCRNDRFKRALHHSREKSCQIPSMLGGESHSEWM
jgi:hypothetical protein